MPGQRGKFFEGTYREERGLGDSLDFESYIDLILSLKNKIGGGFYLESAEPHCIRVKNSCCPFGDGVTHFPELCRMTSSVFGGIAARNFGYAKVEIAESIARKILCSKSSLITLIFDYPAHAGIA